MRSRAAACKGRVGDVAARQGRTVCAASCRCAVPVFGRLPALHCVDVCPVKLPEADFKPLRGRDERGAAQVADRDPAPATRVLDFTMSEPFYCSEQIHIPPELPEILKQFTKAAIKTAPPDAELYSWAAQYFHALANGGLPSVSTRAGDGAGGGYSGEPRTAPREPLQAAPVGRRRGIPACARCWAHTNRGERARARVEGPRLGPLSARAHARTSAQLRPSQRNAVPSSCRQLCGAGQADTVCWPLCGCAAAARGLLPGGSLAARRRGVHRGHSARQARSERPRTALCV